MSIENTLAKELKAQPKQVVSAIELLDSGASVPFIARYRKEATGGLDDTQLRQLEEKLTYYRGLDERRATILKSIESQDQLSDKLRQQILAANTKQQLEDLYLPFRPKRKSKGKTAIQAGLQPLADELLSNPSLNPEIEARKYINTDKNVPDSQAALDGAKAILTERFSEMTELVSELRNFIRSEGYIISKVKKDKEKDGAKFQD